LSFAVFVQVKVDAGAIMFACRTSDSLYQNGQAFCQSLSTFPVSYINHALR